MPFAEVDSLTNFFADRKLNIIDHVKLNEDMNELEVIATAIPKDNIVNCDDAMRLERKCLQGMNICDYWIPIIHIVASELESDADVAKSTAFINAAAGEKMTVELRKAKAEADTNYNKLLVLTEKVKSMKTYFDRKRDSFKSAIFVFQDHFKYLMISGATKPDGDIYNNQTTMNEE